MIGITYDLVNTFISSLFLPLCIFNTLKNLLGLKNMRKIRKKKIADAGDRTHDHKIRRQFDVGITKISIFGKFFDQVPTNSDT